MARPTPGERLKSRVVAVVAAIPEGRVTTYGAIARHLKRSPREVARVLSSFSPDESAAYPWYRVVAANGAISSMKLGAVGRRQVALLRTEGVRVTARNTIVEFHSVFWTPQRPGRGPGTSRSG